MKTRILSFICLVMAVFAVAPNVYADDPAPAITFDTKKYDFGDVKESGPLATCEFEFTNTGDAPLIIVSATASCGCTTPSYPKEPIKPGKKGKIKVSYNPKGRYGAFNKTVTVRSNAKKQSRISLRITGTVVE